MPAPGQWFSESLKDGRFAASLRGSINAEKREAQLRQSASLDGNFYPPTELKARYVADAKQLRTTYDAAEEFSALYASLREAASRRSREALKGSLRLADRKRFELAARHLYLHDQLRGLSTWSASTRERARLLGIAKAMAARVKRLGLSRSWNSWVSAATAQASQALRKAARHLLNRLLSKGWIGWCVCMQVNPPDVIMHIDMRTCTCRARA